MRPVEIQITVFKKEVTEILGCADRSSDVLCRCFIDLDQVESVWEDPPAQGGDGILIKLKSGDSFWTKTFALDVFVSLWKNEAGLQSLQLERVHTGIGLANDEPCPLCQEADVCRKGYEFECNSCGFKWVISNAPKNLK
jgi:hypothetical protein